MNMGFYGGRPGQSFNIKEIFPNKVALDQDLAKSWTSPINVGEFVVISYGMVHDNDYELKKSIDLNTFGKSYNSTLWRKDYVDADGSGSAAGLKYTLIASMTGNTPRLSVIEPITVLNADENPDVDGDNTDPDFFYLTFKLPQSQVLTKGEDIVLNADKMPSVAFDDQTDINHPQITFSLPQSQILVKADPFLQILDANKSPNIIFDDETDINKPRLGFELPQSQVIEEIRLDVVDSNIQPTIEFDTSVDGTINRPIIKFTLPKAQLIQLGQTIEANADETPSVAIDNTDPSNPVLTFTLPQSQIMGEPTTVPIGPSEVPSVSLDSTDINSPFLKFQLPRAVKFYYGSKLGLREVGTYIETDPSFADYATGDYYINASTGFIYLITEKIGNTCTFVYQASIQQPLPDTITSPINPYQLAEDGSRYEPANPTVSRHFTNNDGTQWKINFGLPTAPVPQVEVEWLGPEEEGKEGTVTPSNETDITFNLKIPQGAKIFAGLKVYDGDIGQSIDIGASIGDLYLNTETGNLYKWLGGLWVKQEGNLKGPVGDALNIVREYTIDGSIISDTIADVSAYIEQQYVDSAGVSISPDPDEIFAINWVGQDSEGNNIELSYWYYKTEEGNWGRAQLTGGIGAIIENEYNDEADGPVTNKTYSINYINSLIGGIIEHPDRETFSTEQILALFSWGTFDDTGVPDWFPEDSVDPSTLSAEEIIQLMSWGSILELTI